MSDSTGKLTSHVPRGAPVSTHSAGAGMRGGSTVAAGTFVLTVRKYGRGKVVGQMHSQG